MRIVGKDNEVLEIHRTVVYPINWVWPLFGRSIGRLLPAEFCHKLGLLAFRIPGFSWLEMAYTPGQRKSDNKDQK